MSLMPSFFVPNTALNKAGLICVFNVSFLIPFWLTEWYSLFPSVINFSFLKLPIDQGLSLHVLAPMRLPLSYTHSSALAPELSLSLQHLGWVLCLSALRAVYFQLSWHLQVTEGGRNKPRKNPTTLYIFNIVICLTCYFIQYLVKWDCTSCMGTKMSIT